jgi:nicotinamide riboside transporter PnuC
MTMTSPQTTTNGRHRDTEATQRETWRETRLFAKTSEFWAMLVGIAAIVVIYNAADDSSFDLWHACLLGTVLAATYIVSRGFAKAGTRTADHWDSTDDR